MLTHGCSRTGENGILSHEVPQYAPQGTKGALARQNAAKGRFGGSEYLRGEKEPRAKPLSCLKNVLDLETNKMSEAGAQERQGTRVTFLDQTGAKSVDAVIADTVTVKRILPNIITKMSLPVMGPDGQPMSYSLDHKEGGKRLREDETLIQARVTDGDHLIVYPEIVAGSSV